MPGPRPGAQLPSLWLELGGMVLRLADRLRVLAHLVVQLTGLL